MRVPNRITKDEFIDAFKGLNGWSDTFKNNYSSEGLLELYRYLKQEWHFLHIDDDIDRIMIADQYREFKTIEEFNENYDEEFKTIEELENVYSLVLKINQDGFIIRA